MEYFQQPFDNMLTVPFDPYVFDEGVQNRFKYNLIINQCINHKLKKEFSLMAHSEVLYCDVKGESKEIGKCILQLKVIDILFYILHNLK